jgi:hypothetical protein
MEDATAAAPTPDALRAEYARLQSAGNLGAELDFLELHYETITGKRPPWADTEKPKPAVVKSSEPAKPKPQPVREAALDRLRAVGAYDPHVVAGLLDLSGITSATAPELGDRIATLRVERPDVFTPGAPWAPIEAYGQLQRLLREGRQSDAEAFMRQHRGVIEVAMKAAGRLADEARAADRAELNEVHSLNSSIRQTTLRRTGYEAGADEIERRVLELKQRAGRFDPNTHGHAAATADLATLSGQLEAKRAEIAKMTTEIAAAKTRLDELVKKRTKRA